MTTSTSAATDGAGPPPAQRTATPSPGRTPPPPPAAPAGAPAPRPPAAPEASGRPIRLLTLSSLYPNPAQPNHGVFVENRLRHLVASGRAESAVVAPVPWFPLPRFMGRGVPRGAVPAEELRHGLRVLHPRFVALPKLGLLTNPPALLRAARGAARRLVAQGHRPDLLDAHYLFPDGVAALALARELGVPLVVTARGSDASQLPHQPFAGAAIRRLLREADALVAVSQGLADGLLALGAAPSKVTVLRNGVDTDLFRPPADRAALRAQMGFSGPTLVSVGLLVPRKRHHLTIGALRHLPAGTRLVILGEGAERPALEALAREAGVADRVSMPGARPHAELPRWYGAADLMVLASEREGWANVLLESMACGTPVVATPAWGMGEAISSPAAGLVLGGHSERDVADGVARLLAAPPERAATRAHAERFGWEETTQGQLALFARLLAERGRPAA